MKPTRCQATNQQAKPCGAEHYRDGWCRWHHPDLEGERRAWSAKGGSARSNKARAKRQLPDGAMEIGELGAWLGVVFRRLIAGDVEPGVATAAASLSRAMVEVARAGHVEDRIIEIERQLGIERSAS